MADYNSAYTGEEIDAAVGNAKTASDLKTAYESNADTNAFTDAEQAKLANQSGTNTGDQDISGIATNASDILALESEQITQNSAIALNTAKKTYPLVDENKLSGIETGADVTDTANVTAAGALMDSEVVNLEQVKAFDSRDYATAGQGSLADTALQSGDNISDLSNDENYIPSDVTGVEGADKVANIISLTQDEYDAIETPDASTLYIING
jgi:hypothetical protein